MRAIGDYLGVKVHACVGETSIREDQRILFIGVHVVFGTPGRVFDMLRRQSLRPDKLGCSFWMRLMRCFHEASKIRSMTYSSSSPQKCRWVYSQPPCFLRPLKSQGSL